MNLQLIIIAIFVLNVLVIWLSVFNKELEWYRIPGVIIFTALPFVTVFFEQPRFELDFFWWRVVGIAAIVAGALIAGKARLEFKNAEMWPLDLPKTLITSGPYQYFRHPQYLGLIFIWIGWWWIWAAAYAFYFGMFILALAWIEAYLEEKFILEKTFGNQYHEYCQHAGMFWIK